MANRRQLGLTLVELMVVVAVLAIIAAIGYPMYTAQTQKSRRADAKIAVESVALAQERYFTLNGQYASGLSSLQVSTALKSGKSDKGYYDVTIARPQVDEFTATATAGTSGAQASDSKCQTFTINQIGTKTATQNSCW